jgi:hypothetical protein
MMLATITRTNLAVKLDRHTTVVSDQPLREPMSRSENDPLSCSRSALLVDAFPNVMALGFLVLDDRAK